VVRLRLLSLLATLAIAPLAGCGGGGGNSTRTGVNQFLDHVNAMQQTAAPQFQRANRAYLAFSKGKLPTPQAKLELTQAEQVMRDVRDRIERTKAPAPAAELKRRLVALFDADAAMAHEATLLATFVPAAQKAATPLPGLAKRLATGLRGAKTAAGQEVALAAYSQGVGRVITRLQPLDPPPLLLDRHHAQLDHLRAVRRLSDELVRALKAADSAKVSSLLKRFQTLSSQGSGGAVSSGALAAYNRRYVAIQHAGQAVERERRRLEKTLK
jgi:hypothetical protein